MMLDVLLLFSSICTAVVGGRAPQTITGFRGERVDIRCSYKSGYESNSKYFCKGECSLFNKIIMVESGSRGKDKRFSLTDDTTARVFTVTITDLRTEDQGQYWCGVEGFIFDDYSKIALLVKDGNNTTGVSTISPSSKTPSSSSTTQPSPHSENDTRTTTENTVQLHQPNTNLASVAGGLGSVLLVLTLCCVTFIILKKRKRKSGTALFQQNMQRKTETDRMYEEIPDTVTVVTSSSNQTPASHRNNCTEVSTVYATVTNQQPDSNPGHTRSTNQVTDTAGDYNYASIKFPEATQDSGIEVIYTTATNPKNISTIYSVINHK
ncbi:CMRF35-like molecule 3 [Pimephales promelas]|uniref:CMRF35-like molecule 3 n=1 Tax=Pimephales promelas TaxID=90988 RepID=UPI001955BA3C|nr:CMRF35-like molecule 3 [Pimephales promelas]